MSLTRFNLRNAFKLPYPIHPPSSDRKVILLTAPSSAGHSAFEQATIQQAKESGIKVVELSQELRSRLPNRRSQIKFGKSADVFLLLGCSKDRRIVVRTTRASLPRVRKFPTEPLFVTPKNPLSRAVQVSRHLLQTPRSTKHSMLSLAIGHTGLSSHQLQANLQTVMTQVIAALPIGEDNIRSIYLSATFSPSVRLYTSHKPHRPGYAHLKRCSVCRANCVMFGQIKKRHKDKVDHRKWDAATDPRAEAEAAAALKLSLARWKELRHARHRLQQLSEITIVKDDTEYINVIVADDSTNGTWRVWMCVGSKVLVLLICGGEWWLLQTELRMEECDLFAVRNGGRQALFSTDKNRVVVLELKPDEEEESGTAIVETRVLDLPFLFRAANEQITDAILEADGVYVVAYDTAEISFLNTATLETAVFTCGERIRDVRFVDDLIFVVGQQFLNLFDAAKQFRRVASLPWIVDADNQWPNHNFNVARVVDKATGQQHLVVVYNRTAYLLKKRTATPGLPDMYLLFRTSLQKVSARLHTLPDKRVFVNTVSRWRELVFTEDGQDLALGKTMQWNSFIRGYWNGMTIRFEFEEDDLIFHDEESELRVVRLPNATEEQMKTITGLGDHFLLVVYSSRVSLMVLPD